MCRCERTLALPSGARLATESRLTGALISASLRALWWGRVLCTRNLPKAAEFLLLTFFLPARVLLPSSSQSSPHLQAVDEKQVELFFIFFLQDLVVLHLGQVVLHIVLHFVEATGERNTPSAQTAILMATTCVPNRDRSTSDVRVTGRGHSGAIWKVEKQLCHGLPDVI